MTKRLTVAVAIVLIICGLGLAAIAAFAPYNPAALEGAPISAETFLALLAFAGIVNANLGVVVLVSSLRSKGAR